METKDARLKRMTMRSWRRGTKEMDMILGPWADANLAGLDAARLELYEVLLAANDADLLNWVLGKAAPPEALAGLMAEITAYSLTRFQSKE
ncbi:MAG: succinate dehydrogenase assembly factor 2 [Pseudorhodobacter sp.]|nr:succinate dehydrogenase assembly factor 2 [Pseudorhodobacter sp.]